jgi:hypothetical protein
MKKILLALFIFYFSAFIFSNENWQIADSETAVNELSTILEKIDTTFYPALVRYKGSNLKSKTIASEENGVYNSISEGLSLWDISLNTAKSDEGFFEGNCSFEVKKGLISAAGTAAIFKFDSWSDKNFLMIPSAAYNGNRFEKKKVGYPPFLFDKNLWNPNGTEYITDIPALSPGNSASIIELTTGDMSVPAVVIFFPSKRKALFVYTSQQIQGENFGVIFEESSDKQSASLVFSYPGVRSSWYSGLKLNSGIDKGKWFHRGDRVEFPFKVIVKDCSDINEMYRIFFETRDSFISPNSYNHVTPYSAAWDIQENLQNNLRWKVQPDGLSYYKNGNGNTPPGQIQLGWVGGMMELYPMFMRGNEQTVKRAYITLNTIISRMQGSSGLFYGMYGDGRVYGDGFDYSKEAIDIAMTRKNGDGLFYLIKILSLLKEKNMEIKPDWEFAAQKWSEAFCSMFDKYGHFGQLISPETGEILIGKSAAGSIVPSALVLAGKYFNNSRYSLTGESAAEVYYLDFIKQGYTNGGPGEILMNPDSESAFAALETFSTIYEATGNSRYLEMAQDCAAYCSSWVVAYDYKFSESSLFYKKDIKTSGAVWASTQNKHAAPGICTSSGLALLKLYRATGNRLYLDWLQDTAHNILGYMSTSKRPVGTDKDGYLCERVNLSDWEGRRNIGSVGPWANSWSECAIMLTVTEIPGIYIVKDLEEFTVFDHLNVEKVQTSDGSFVLKILNPTPYDSVVSIFSENSDDMKKSLPEHLFPVMQKIEVKAGESINFTVK